LSYEHDKGVTARPEPSAPRCNAGVLYSLWLPAALHERRELPHIKRLDDAFGMFLVRIRCECGRSVRASPRRWQLYAVPPCPKRRLPTRRKPV